MGFLLQSNHKKHTGNYRYAKNLISSIKTHQDFGWRRWGGEGGGGLGEN